MRLVILFLLRGQKTSNIRSFSKLYIIRTQLAGKELKLANQIAGEQPAFLNLFLAPTALSRKTRMKQAQQPKADARTYSSSVETKDGLMEPAPASSMCDDNYCMLTISRCLSLDQSEHPSDLIDVEYFEALRQLQSAKLTIGYSQDNLNLEAKSEKEHRKEAPADNVQRSSIYRLQLRFQGSQLSFASSYQSSDFTNLRPFPEINTSFDERLLESENKENVDHETDNTKTVLPLSEHLSVQTHHQQQPDGCVAVSIFGKSDLLEAIQTKRQHFIQNSRRADYKGENCKNSGGSGGSGGGKNSSNSSSSSNMERVAASITSTAIKLAPTGRCKRQKRERKYLQRPTAQSQGCTASSGNGDRW